MAKASTIPTISTGPVSEQLRVSLEQRVGALVNQRRVMFTTLHIIVYSLSYTWYAYEHNTHAHKVVMRHEFNNHHV